MILSIIKEIAAKINGLSISWQSLKEKRFYLAPFSSCKIIHSTAYFFHDLAGLHSKEKQAVLM